MEPFKTGAFIIHAAPPCRLLLDPSDHDRGRSKVLVAEALAQKKLRAMSGKVTDWCVRGWLVG